MKDKRYNTIKILIENHHISQLSDIFDTLPKTVLAKDMGMNYGRFLRKIKSLEWFDLKEIYTIADLINVDRNLVLKIIDSQASKNFKNQKIHIE